MEKRLLTQAEWARERGVSKPYVSKLVKTGKVALIDGKIDPEDAARRLAATGDPVKGARKELTGLTGGLTQPADFEPHEKNPGPEDTRSDEIDAKLLPDQLLRARIKREREEGRLKELDRKRREGELVEAAEVREEHLRRATEEREALLNWPSRVGALMAAELEIDERRLVQILRKYVRQHLSERSSAT